MPPTTIRFRSLGLSLASLGLVAACGGISASPDAGEPTPDAAPPKPDAGPVADAPHAPVCVQPPTGLTAWWRGENNARDEIGTNQGTVNGGITFGAAEVGRGFVFDGSDDYVSVFHQGALYPTGSFAIEAWVTAPHRGTLLEMYECGGVACDDSNPSLLMLRINDDRKVELTVRDNNAADGGQLLVSLAGLSDGASHHVVAVRDLIQNALKVYVDGERDVAVPLNDSGSGPLTASGDDDPLTIGAGIGASTTAPSDYFQGVIDELSFYLAPLSDEQVAALYAAGPAGKCAQ